MAGRAKNGPGSEAVTADLREQIQSGKFAPGEPLPSYDKLREIYNASPTVVRYAVKSLETERLVETRPGIGKFVTDPSRWQPSETAGIMRELVALRDEVRELRRQADDNDRQLDGIGRRVDGIERRLDQAGS